MMDDEEWSGEQDRLIDDLEWQIHDLKMELDAVIRERDHYRRVIEDMADRACRLQTEFNKRAISGFSETRVDTTAG